MTASLALSAELGLAMVAALWWAYFGAGDDDRAEEAMRRADPAGARCRPGRAWRWAAVLAAEREGRGADSVEA